VKAILQRAYLDNGVISGNRGFFDLSKLQYDSKWLEDPSEFFRELWCTLHTNLPHAAGSCNPFDIAAWIAAMAYSDPVHTSAIQTLAAFYNMRSLSSVQPPLASQFDLSKGEHFKPAEIQALATSAARSFGNSTEAKLPKQVTETNKQHSARIRKLFQGRRDQAIKALTSVLESQWPCTNPTTPNTAVINKYTQVSAVMTGISAKFKAWFDNRRSVEYLNQLSAALSQKNVIGISVPSYAITFPAKRNTVGNASRFYNTKGVFDMAPDTITCSKLIAPPEPSFSAQLATQQDDATQMKSRLEILCQALQSYASSACEKEYVGNLCASCASLEQRDGGVPLLDTSSISNIQVILSEYLEACEEYLAYLKHALLQAVESNGSLSDQIDVRTQHSPRISPTFWLAQLHQDRFGMLSKHWKSAIIEFGLAVTQVHRAQRLIAVSNKPVDLAEELRHVGHNNWKPEDFPEMLLLEAESGITIREEQEYIASQMRNPEDGRNIVLQLLMGGGKSSTIVPVLAVNFTNKRELVRVIVAKPQSKQMQHMLVAKLGGLLNRRIYHMPFSRNLRLKHSDAVALRQVYEDCIKKRGVLLTQPEHILSFKLMGIESLLIEQPSTAAHLLGTQDFFDKKSRDIVDESDMNFSVKFELIYTMGSQQSIEFAPER
jgi:hypothetical protein